MNLTPKQKRELSKLLLDCAIMKTSEGRDRVVADLSPQIGAVIIRDSSSIVDIVNIVDSCLGYPDGLAELLEIIQDYVGNSTAMQAVLRFREELGNQKPTPAPKPEPTSPLPKPQPDPIPDNPAPKPEPTSPLPKPQPDPIVVIDPVPKLPAPTPAFTLTSPNELIWAKDGKAMVRVPAGEFLYGDKKQKMELPEFWIDKTPVTNAEYARFVAEKDREPPSHWSGKTPPIQITTHPVVYVTWHDAVAYAEWAGKQLPPEEYWEKAARGTDGRKYPWGDNEPTDKLCNFNRGVGKILWSLVATTYYTTPVGQYSPQGDSPYGCVDMAGNVWDWTASFYQIDNDYRVLRGGAWDYDSVALRCACRNYGNPYLYFNLIGFRCFFVPIF